MISDDIEDVDCYIGVTIRVLVRLFGVVSAAQKDMIPLNATRASVVAVDGPAG